MFEIHLHGLQEAIQGIRKVSKESTTRSREFVLKAQHHCYSRLMVLTPVDTGYMKSRWRKQPIRKTVQGTEVSYLGRISNDTEYLPYVNYGHWTVNRVSYVNGQFFVEKALRQTQRYLEQEMKG